MYHAALPSKPGAPIAYSLYSVKSPKTGNVLARTNSTTKQVTASNDVHGPPLSLPPARLIVFLNNLLMPASSWEPAIDLSINPKATTVSATSVAGNPSGSDNVEADDAWTTVPILTYDRFGQGLTTARDPADSEPGKEPGYGHDFSDVVRDLKELIEVVWSKHFTHRQTNPTLLLVGASIGAPLARIFAHRYKGQVEGLVILDSNIANRSYSDFWPDPNAKDFDPNEVAAPDCTLEQYIETTKALAKLFDPAVKNNESLDRRNVAELLPAKDKPILIGPDNKKTKVVVVGHDKEAFAREGYDKMRTPLSFTRRWTQPAWDSYNEGLLQIGDTTDNPSVIYAPGCGHFIQRDNPEFVANTIRNMLLALEW